MVGDDVGGMLGGGSTMIIGYCTGALVCMNSSAFIDGVGAAIILSTLVFGPLGAMAGGNIAGQLFDRYNGYDNCYDEPKD